VIFPDRRQVCGNDAGSGSRLAMTRSGKTTHPKRAQPNLSGIESGAAYSGLVPFLPGICVSLSPESHGV